MYIKNIDQQSLFQALPLTWVLMPNETRESYTAVIMYFKNILAPHLHPATCMTDYEIPLYTAILSIYNNITASGCFFHFTKV